MSSLVRRNFDKMINKFNDNFFKDVWSSNHMDVSAIYPLEGGWPLEENKWTEIFNANKLKKSVKDNKYLYEIDIPGFSKEEINVELNENSINVSASKKEEKDGYSSRESVSKVFSLPEDINKDTLTVSLKDGVLLISVEKVPKLEENKKKKLEIK